MDGQNKHKDIWEREHSQQSSFAAMHTTKPSAPLPGFVEYIKQQGFNPSETRVLDLGCGKGRNSIYLASQGFHVIGIDFSEKALNDARQRSASYSSLIEYEQVDITKEWPFGTNYFDIIIDCNASIYIPDHERGVVITEAHRVLKPGGLYLFYGIAETKTILPSAGSNPLAPHPVFTEKHYTQQELMQTYAGFTVVSLQLIQASDRLKGEDVQNALWSMIVQKPSHSPS